MKSREINPHLRLEPSTMDSNNETGTVSGVNYIGLEDVGQEEGKLDHCER